MAKKATRASVQRNLLGRIKAYRIQKVSDRLARKRSKQTEKARKKKAKLQAVREDAVKQVENAVIKSKQRRSRPLVTLILMALTIGLSGAFVWQYRESEVIDRDDQIVELESRVKELSGLERRIAAEEAVEEAKFTRTQFQGFSLKLPADWQVKPTQFPAEETVYGNDNVSLRVIVNSLRTGSDKFIPEVDYIWVSSVSDQGSLSVSAKSLHCERFDTFDNDLADTLREHSGFSVYCDSESEKVIIFIASSPSSYGSGPSQAYFIIEITDIQQANISEIESVLTSYTLSDQQ